VLAAQHAVEVDGYRVAEFGRWHGRREVHPRSECGDGYAIDGFDLTAWNGAEVAGVGCDQVRYRGVDPAGLGSFVMDHARPGIR